MSSISESGDGSRRLLFLDANGKRSTLYLGKTPKKECESIKSHVDAIVNAQLSRSPIPRETATWLGSIPDKLRAKLARLGLADAVERKEAPATVAGYAEAYIVRRTDLKPATVTYLKLSARALTEFAGKVKRLDAFTRGDCISYVRWLRDRYAPASVGRITRQASQFFTDAIDHELLDRNPFRGVKTPPPTNAAKSFNVDLETTRKLFDAAHGETWRLILALSRWGGLRIPSELYGLLWEDVEWDAGRFFVRSPKTEHHEGGESRWVPIFPELRPYLEAAKGQGVMIPPRGNRRSMLKKRLAETLSLAGVEQWPRIWQNMRATRETELAAVYPLHVVCAWIGNSARIASKHYLQVTPEDFRRASDAKSDANSDVEAARKGWKILESIPLTC